ncbi:MAG: hypothetical protein GTO18_07695 [Anaerolineales bacterium]|nr:hypothetical protein [Anaerolineales bacterium]
MTKVENDLAKILDECLSRLQSGEASLADCVREYPEYAETLTPLLEHAITIHASMAPSSPSASYVSTTKLRILNQMGAIQKAKKDVSKPIRPQQRRWMLRPALALLSIFLVAGILLSGAGVMSASADALPGDSLYSVKRGMEEARLSITFNNISEAELLALYVAERVEEAEALAVLGDGANLYTALMGYETMLDRLLTQLDEEPPEEESEVLKTIHFGLTHHEEVLTALLENASEGTKKGLENAIEKSGHGRAVIEQLQQGGSPSDLAPGRTKTPKGQSEDHEGGPPEDKGPKDNPPGKPPTKTPKPK